MRVLSQRLIILTALQRADPVAAAMSVPGGAGLGAAMQSSQQRGEYDPADSSGTSLALANR